MSHYMPYFTGSLLDIKISKNAHINRYPECLAQNVTAVLISISMATSWILHKFSRLCIRGKQTNKLLLTCSCLLSYISYKK